MPPYSGADGNGDGKVDDADYLLWKANFGRTAEPGGGAVDAGDGPQAADERSTAGRVRRSEFATRGSTHEQDALSGELRVSSGTRAVRLGRGLELLGRDERGGRAQMRLPTEPGPAERLPFVVQHWDLALLAWRSSLEPRGQGPREAASIASTVDVKSHGDIDVDSVFEEMGLEVLSLCTR